MLASLAIGSKSIPFRVVVESLRSFDPELVDHLIVRELRLPRTLDRSRSPIS